ncbi:MAG: hypothetical protein IJ861_05245 [Clostridia bacterium]|nr:hypothetical protein [Clostridia bacterium]
MSADAHNKFYQEDSSHAAKDNSLEPAIIRRRAADTENAFNVVIRFE